MRLQSIVHHSASRHVRSNSIKMEGPSTSTVPLIAGHPYGSMEPNSQRHVLPPISMPSQQSLEGTNRRQEQALPQTIAKRKRGKYSKAKCEQCRKDKKKVADKYTPYCLQL